VNVCHQKNARSVSASNHCWRPLLMRANRLQVSHVQAVRRQAIGVLDAVVDTALLRALVRVREFASLVTLMIQVPLQVNTGSVLVLLSSPNAVLLDLGERLLLKHRLYVELAAL
jgi:hypothetical protein